MTEQVPKLILGKKSPQSITEKLNQKDMSRMSQVEFGQANFGLLHKSAQYPVPAISNARNSMMNMTHANPFINSKSTNPAMLAAH